MTDTNLHNDRNGTDSPSHPADMINKTIFTAAGEIALVTRINETRQGETQLYGVLCTGPLVDSMNSAGQPNEFLITPADGEV